MNANEVLHNVEDYIVKAQSIPNYKFRIDDVFEDLGIFDWWHDYLSVSQLKQMQSFLKTAIKLGYDGYVCFKVGASGCAHGMWAHKNESTTGYSPDGECLYHSFRNGDNYWDACDKSNNWFGLAENKYNGFSLKELMEKIS